MKCKHHGPAAPGVWACPTCLVELRDQVNAAQTEAYAEGRKDERAEVDWAEDCARILLTLKDTLAERGARPTTPEKAAMWDEAWSVYTRMLAWANPTA